MNTTPLDLILRQSYLHIVSYGLVLSILFVALADGYLIGHLKRALRVESGRLRQGDLAQDDLARMVHPVAGGLGKVRGPLAGASPSTLRHHVELAEASLFVPLRARMSLTRDLSTLMGLIATLLALVAAATDFARHGKPELLIGSVGTGCVATCVAAIGCAIALWNLSRLTRLRLEIACETEDVLGNICPDRGPEGDDEVPIQFVTPTRMCVLNSEPQENHAPL
jgi:hypothetical protein